MNHIESTTDLVNKKVGYFIEYWLDVTHESNSIEGDLVHFILYNPKELIKEFIEEIERNQLSNRDNRKFFTDKVNGFAKLKLDALKFLEPTLKLIQSQFSKKDDFGYLLHLLKMALLEFDNNRLAKESIKELSNHLTDPGELDQIKVKSLVNLIIFELMHKKYSQEKIIKIINDIFSSYQTINKTILTNFPHTLQPENWNVESVEYQGFERKLTAYLDSLTINDRISSITNYFNLPSEKLRYLFQLRGLKGDDVNLFIGNVQIYSPKKTRLIQDSGTGLGDIDETFNASSGSHITYCNAAVSLDVLDSEYAKMEAIQTLENTLDIIASKYTYYKVPLSINTSQYYVINQDGEIRQKTSSNTLEVLIYQDSIELHNSKFPSEVFAQQVSKDQISQIDKKIFESMHWKRKATESDEINEKVLWHWVSLENIFERKSCSTPKTIFESVSKILAKKYIYDFAWKYYWKLESCANGRGDLQHYRANIILPQDLSNIVGFNAKEGQEIKLKNLIDNIAQIQKHIDADSLLSEQLHYLNELFTDSKKFEELLKKFQDIFFEKLVYVYRMRNKIVHNAHNEVGPMSKYYADFLALASAASINSFIQIRARLSLKSSDEIVNNINYEFDKFLLDLKEKGSSILL